MRYIAILIILLLVLVSCTEQQPVSNEPEQKLIIMEPEEQPVACARGFIADEYPGNCGQYTDGDENHICDLSE